MIIVTVGTQLGFDRLIAAMDDLAPQLGMPVIAQTGKGSYAPRNMDARAKIAPSEFEKLVGGAKLIVAHAGIGMVGLLILRIISLHQVDAVLFGPLKLNWVGDVGASLWVMAAAIYYVRVVTEPPR